jgi:hypothetical protein
MMQHHINKFETIDFAKIAFWNLPVIKLCGVLTGSSELLEADVTTYSLTTKVTGK